MQLLSEPKMSTAMEVRLARYFTGLGGYWGYLGVPGGSNTGPSRDLLLVKRAGSGHNGPGTN